MRKALLIYQLSVRSLRDNKENSVRSVYRERLDLVAQPHAWKSSPRVLSSGSLQSCLAWCLAQQRKASARDKISSGHGQVFRVDTGCQPATLIRAIVGFLGRGESSREENVRLRNELQLTLAIHSEENQKAYEAIQLREKVAAELREQVDSLTKELKKPLSAERLAEDLSNIIAEDVAKAAYAASRQPDPLDSALLEAYSHDTYVESYTSNFVGVAILISFVRSIIHKAYAIRNGFSAQTKSLSWISMFIAQFWAAVLFFVSNRTAIWPFAILAQMKAVTKSALAVDAIGKLYLAGWSNATLCERIKGCVTKAQSQTQIAWATMRVNLRASYDNAGHYAMGTSRNTMATIASNMVVTFRILTMLFDKQARAFVQGDARNSPIYWPSFALCPPNILWTTHSEEEIIEKHALSILSDACAYLASIRYAHGDGGREKTVKPVVKRTNDDEVLQKVCHFAKLLVLWT